MIAGIDYSREYIDIVLLNDDTDTATWHRYDLRGKPDRAWDAARRTRATLPGPSFWDDTWLCGIESGYRGRVNAVRALSLVQGAILACIPSSVTVVPIPEEEHKRVFCGSAKAIKEDIAQQAIRLGAQTLWVQDAYDAYSVAWCARELNERAIRRAS